MFVIGFRNDIVLEKPFEFPKPAKLEKKMQDFLFNTAAKRYYLSTKRANCILEERAPSKVDALEKLEK